MRKILTIVGVFAALLVLALGVITAGRVRTVVKLVRVPTSQPVQTIFIRNLDPRDFSDMEILHDIPAWEQALNHDFARFWSSSQYRIVLGHGPTPAGDIEADFVSKGPVKGALAYHTVLGNRPQIVVYSGTSRYYGYDISEDFTHEAFELAADPLVSSLSYGWPYDYVWFQQPDGSLKVSFQGNWDWVQEVSDPVEADGYRIDGVLISDFVTPSWFNQGVGERFDFMGLCGQPFTLLPGGYAQFQDPNGFHVLLNFRGAGRDARGFYLGERGTH